MQRAKQQNNSVFFLSEETLLLLKYLDIVYQSLDENKEVTVVYTDFEKAFDRVDHGILLKKLYCTGVRGKLFKLMKSYILGRQQQVRVNDSLSKPIKVSSGVPQGATLASILFLIYINDLPDECRFSIPLLAADDSKFIGMELNSNNFQADMNNIYNWSEVNCQPFNVKKCAAITFGRSTYNHNLMFNGDTIPTANQQKDLGILITENLNWIGHITTAIGKARKVYQMVRRNSPMLTTIAKLNLYKSMMLPILLYGSHCLAANVTQARKLEHFQTSVVKWILPEENYRSALIMLNILPLHLYMQITDILLLHKIVIGYYDCDLSEHYTINPNLSMARNTSNIFRLHIPRLEQCRQNFWFRTARLVNLMPPEIQFLKTDGLKQRLLKYSWKYFQQYFNSESPCTWKLFCDCTLNNCRNKLTYISF